MNAEFELTRRKFIYLNYFFQCFLSWVYLGPALLSHYYGKEESQKKKNKKKIEQKKGQLILMVKLFTVVTHIKQLQIFWLYICQTFLRRSVVQVSVKYQCQVSVKRYQSNITLSILYAVFALNCLLFFFSKNFTKSLNCMWRWQKSILHMYKFSSREIQRC